MKLEHIALTISEPEEVKNFYKDILGLTEVKTFAIKESLANDIFGLNEEASVFLLQKDNLLLEVFIRQETKRQSFNHICLSVNDRESLFRRAKQKNYECIRIERDTYDLIFIKDKSGNVFEIKEE
ncbi:MAG: VOC family protein [Ignavibacteria bacterium]|nr:VOC family protein [Ignavibacteria bacterium]